jgi:hypothetical protein
MSWDVVLFNSKQKITSPEKINKDLLVPVDFSAVFEAYFSNIKSDKRHRSVTEDGFSIEYFVDEQGELSSNTLLNLYGEKAIYPLIDLAKKHGWQIFDTASGEMIDLNDPSKNGYNNFQLYLTRL